MKKTKLIDGTAVIEFKDDYDRDCRLYPSSSAEAPAIWLGINKLGHRMHLTQSQVKKLLPHLERFVKTGEL